MKNKIFSLMIMAAFVLCFGAMAFAQDAKPATDDNAPMQRGEGFRKFKGGKEGKFGRHGEGDKMGFHAFKDLNLTEDQKTQIKALAENNQKTLQPQREEMRGLMQQKRSGATLTAEQENRFKELRGQMRQNEEITRTQILAILTPEQRTRLEQKQQEMRQKMEERRQQRQSAPPATTDKPTNN